MLTATLFHRRKFKLIAVLVSSSFFGILLQWGSARSPSASADTGLHFSKDPASAQIVTETKSVRKRAVLFEYFGLGNRNDARPDARRDVGARACTLADGRPPRLDFVVASRHLRNEVVVVRRKRA